MEKNQTGLENYVFGKVQPQAIPLEEAVLGALMLDRDALAIVTDILMPESFYLEAHQHIYRACIALFNASHPIDLLTVTEELRKAGTLEKCGGSYYLVELSNRVASAANIEWHARIIAQKHIQRGLISISTQTLKDAYQDTTDVFDLLDGVEKSLFALTSEKGGGEAENAFTIGRQVIINADRAMTQRSQGDITGVTSGLKDLDMETGGWQDSDLIIIAARPGMGKTALAVNTIAVSAARSKKPVGLFSMEMSKNQLGARILSGESGVSSRNMANGELHDSDFVLLQDALEGIEGMMLYIDDTPGLSIATLRAKARRMKMKYDIRLFIVDYLQLMSNTDKGGNREQEISTISRGLKALAKELHVPVIALSQLSRAVETRGGSKRPQLSDLRDSGAIEQDADIVMFIYRPEYYEILEDDKGNSTEGLAELIIAKHRNGALAPVMVKFEGRLTKFTDLQKTTPFQPTPTGPTVPVYNPAESMRAARPNDEDIPF